MKNMNKTIGILLIGNVIALTQTQNVTVTVLPGEINIYSPENGAVYTERMVPINLTMNTKVIKFGYNDSKEGPGTLCRNCEEYGYSRIKRKPFDDGFHNITISAVFSAGSVYGYRTFIVDSKKPIIKKTEPKTGYANGSFVVEFQEINPTSLVLNYGNNLTGYRNADLNLNDCKEDKKNTKCEIYVDLGDYDWQEIGYWFKLTDIAKRVDESKLKKLDVDLTKPIINSFNYSIKKRIVTFKFNVTEINFEEIAYIDWNDKNPKEIKLCSRLKNEICEQKKSFRTGEHNLTISVLDEAGNSVNAPAGFEII